MGLDITAYAKVGEYLGTGDELQNKLEEDWMEDSGKPDYQPYTFIHNRDFPERLDNLAEGYYYVSGESLHFGAGAYSAYGRWRDQLAQRAWGCGSTWEWGEGDFMRRAMLPFFELVYMTDCDGVVGPATCAKLAEDFKAHELTIAALSEGDFDPYHGPDGFMGKYRKFRDAFAMAAGEGCVKFH